VRALTIWLTLVAAGVASAQELPDGPGRVSVAARCSACHGSDLITQQRLSRAGWGREIDKMVRWGAVVETPEREALLDYLAAHFAPKGVGASAAAASADYARACLVCHGEDLIAAQRLTRAGWTREVDKMIRWGAAVPEAGKAALVDDLAARFPVRPR
jgi:cytochrome c553